MNLYEATLKTHHQAQVHPFGKRMAGGNISQQEWCDWLGAMAQLYQKLDTYLPPFLKRSPDLFLDLAQLLPLQAHRSKAVDDYIQSFSSPDDLKVIGGLAYLMTGANLRGGQLIRKKLDPKGYPCNFMNFTTANQEEAENWLRKMREFSEFGESTNQAFEMLAAVMDEIEARYNK